MPISISSSARVNDGSPECGTVHGVSAMPIDRTLALTRSAIAVTASRSSPRAAAAPAIFSTSTVPPTPRRPAVQVESLTATSSSMTTARHLDALGVGQFRRGLEVQHVAGVVLHDVQHAGAAVDGLGRGQHLVRGGRGEHRARARRRRACRRRRSHRAAVRARCRRRRPARPCPAPGRRRGRCSPGRVAR